MIEPSEYDFYYTDKDKPDGRGYEGFINVLQWVGLIAACIATGLLAGWVKGLLNN